MQTQVFGILLALTSAAVWGSGDFSGGLATRRDEGGTLPVLALSALSGIGILVLGAAWRGEHAPSWPSALWAAAAGLSGAIGIAALYRALAMGQAAHVAPTAAVVGVAVPVLIGAFTEGWPGALRLVGFAVAALGIWLVSTSARGEGQAARSAFSLALLAGLGFGGFFVLIGQVERGAVFTPLIIARSMTLGLALILLRARRLPLPALGGNPIALLAGLLDAGGNIFYVLARQYTRLDIAAVLSSLYPVSTVVLASLILKQRVSRLQWAGAALCLAAVALISL